MKIKTKRGARRTRNQRVITKRFVTTDYTGCPYITAGKLYEVLRLRGLNKDNLILTIVDDDNFEINPRLRGASHIDYHDWQWGVI